MGFGNEVPGPPCFPLNRAARTAAQAPTAADCKKLFKENVAADYPEKQGGKGRPAWKALHPLLWQSRRAH